MLNLGNVFAGATLPCGMAKPSPETDDPSNQGGFTFTNSNITGFSSMHDSVTGGAPSLGNFPLFAHPSCPEDDINRCAWSKAARKTKFVNESVVSEPGYFSLKLVNGVKVDMTSTQRTSIFRFKIPVSGNSPVILLDLADSSNSRLDNGTISVSAQSARMMGGAPFQASFGGEQYNAYFCADFQGGIIRDHGIFANSRASADIKSLIISRSLNGYPLPGGEFIRFAPGTTSALARVGVSLISAQQACQTAEKETPEFNFESVRTAAQKLWREKLNSIRIATENVNKTFVTLFYSGIYRKLISSQDYTGENPLWKSTEPYFDSFYCLWVSCSPPNYPSGDVCLSRHGD
jgi:putative alpha-1,2-mannosidase